MATSIIQVDNQQDYSKRCDFCGNWKENHIHTLHPFISISEHQKTYQYSHQLKKCRLCGISKLNHTSSTHEHKFET